VATSSTGLGDFDVSRDGTLAYVSPGSSSNPMRTLVWVDRQGHETPISAPPRAYVATRISPDTARVALEIRDQENDIWMWDFSRATLTRFSFGAKTERLGAWTPDSRRVVFCSDSVSGGIGNVVSQAADGTGMPDRLTEGGTQQIPNSVSPDGTRVVIRNSLGDLDVLTLDKDRRVQPLIKTSFTERNGEISPDGRWLVYESNDSGRFEIYVRPFPDVNSGRWQVSNNGGSRALWARNGQELFFVAPDGRSLMRVAVERGTTWNASSPRKLLEGPYVLAVPGIGQRPYDILPDGSRFLVLKPVNVPDQIATPASLVVVQNWFEELRRLVPTR
jgi:eukaryotic-like serine/threonine-protein kinase